MVPSRLTHLGDRIKSCADEIDDFLAANGQQSLGTSSNETQSAILPKEVSQSCATMVDAMDELQMLIRGPLAHLLHLLSPQRVSLMSIEKSLTLIVN